jgi:hypothetical protein
MFQNRKALDISYKLKAIEVAEIRSKEAAACYMACTVLRALMRQEASTALHK